MDPAEAINMRGHACPKPVDVTMKWFMNTDHAAQQSCENLEYWSDGVMRQRTDTPILHHSSTPINRALEDALVLS